MTARSHHRPAACPLSAEPLEDRLTPAGYTEWLNGLAADSAGNVYAAGSFQSRWIDFDPSAGQTGLSIPADDPGDGYLAKYSPAGALVWVTQLAAAGGNGLGAAAVDAADNVYVVGGFTGPATLGSVGLTAAASERCGLVAKLAPDGTVLWARKMPESGTAATPRGLAVDGGGNVYVSGSFSGTADFDPGPGVTSLTADGQDVYVARLDAGGNLAWVRQWGGANTQEQAGAGLAVDAGGAAVYLAGSFLGTLAPAGLTLTDQGDLGQADGFVARLDAATGDIAWATQYADRVPHAAAVDAAGSPYAAGRDSAADALVAWKLDPSAGTTAWERSWCNTSDWANALAVRGGRVLVGGQFRDTKDFDPDPAAQYTLTAAGYADAFVSELTDAGAFVKAWALGGPTANDAETTSAVALDAAGNILTAGRFPAGSSDFDPDPNTTAVLSTGAGVDGYVAKLDAGGTYRWAVQVGGYVGTADDGGAGYGEAGTGWKSAAPSAGGFQGDHRYHAKGSGANKATWTFTGLPPGSYDVVTTWVANSRNASNARYVVNGTAAPAVNQRVAPAGYSDGTTWARLGTYTVGATGTLTVELSDKADGTVIADAVRVVGVGPAGSPLVAAAAPPPGQRAELLAAADLGPLAGEAVARWAAAGAGPGDVARLRAAAVRVADLGGRDLGRAYPDLNAVVVDDDAAGWGWFADPTPGDDAEFTTPGNQGEMNRIDLLSALVHEFGHLLGHDHEEDGAMAETLAPGARVTPAPAAAPAPVAWPTAAAPAPAAPAPAAPPAARPRPAAPDTPAAGAEPAVFPARSAAAPAAPARDDRPPAPAAEPVGVWWGVEL